MNFAQALKIDIYPRFDRYEEQLPHSNVRVKYSDGQKKYYRVEACVTVKDLRESEFIVHERIKYSRSLDERISIFYLEPK